MKRVVILLSIVAFTIVMMSSCKSTQPCPAYGQADNTEQAVKA